MTIIHDEVERALSELQSEFKELETLAGHELLALRDQLIATLGRVRAAKRGSDHEEPEIEAGVGAKATEAGEIHPEVAAGEPQPRSREDIERQAEREPDPNVREKVRQSAEHAPRKKK